MASARASRSSASAEHGRTPRWCSASRIPSATTRCAFPSISAPSAPARTPWSLACASSRAHSAATSATSRPCSGLNTSCSIARRKAAAAFPARAQRHAAPQLRNDVDLPPRAGRSPRLRGHRLKPVETEDVLTEQELPEFDRTAEALIAVEDFESLTQAFPTQVVRRTNRMPRSPRRYRQSISSNTAATP